MQLITLVRVAARRWCMLFYFFKYLIILSYNVTAFLFFVAFSTDSRVINNVEKMLFQVLFFPNFVCSPRDFAAFTQQRDLIYRLHQRIGTFHTKCNNNYSSWGSVRWQCTADERNFSSTLPYSSPTLHPKAILMTLKKTSSEPNANPKYTCLGTDLLVVESSSIKEKQPRRTCVHHPFVFVHLLFCFGFGGGGLQTLSTTPNECTALFNPFERQFLFW